MTEIKVVFEYWSRTCDLPLDRTYTFSLRPSVVMGYVSLTIRSAYKHLLRKFFERGLWLQRSKLHIFCLWGAQGRKNNCCGEGSSEVCVGVWEETGRTDASLRVGRGFTRNLALQPGLRKQREVRAQGAEPSQAAQAAVRLLRLGSDSTINHLRNFHMCLSLSFVICKMELLYYLCHRVYCEDYMRKS